MLLLLLLLAACVFTIPAAAQGDAKPCSFVCAPSLSFDIAANVSHIGMRPKVRSLSTGVVTPLPSTTNTELLLLVAAPTAIPRTSLFTSLQWLPSASATRNPFTEYTAGELGDTRIRANNLSATFGVSVTAVDDKLTRGWGTLAAYAGDLFSNAARPGDKSEYTHKLDLGLNASVTPFSHSVPKYAWLHGVSAIAILDFVATGLPKAGDEVPRGTRVFVDNAHALTLIAGVGLPITMHR
jgi:hypothetical protein